MYQNTMKRLKAVTLLITLLLLGGTFYSCTDNITIEDGETSLSLFYPSFDKIYTLKGGDHNYSIKSNSEEVVVVEMSSKSEFNVKVIGLGETTIMVTDKSKNTLDIDVNVGYQTIMYPIGKLDITIMGDLSEEEKKAISEKYLAKTPVKAKGGYKFVHSIAPYNKGIVTIYKDTYGNDGIETTFEFKSGNCTEPPYYELLIDGEVRTFRERISDPPNIDEMRFKNEMIPLTLSLVEDITEKVQLEYPNAKFVQTSQVVEYEED